MMRWEGTSNTEHRTPNTEHRTPNIEQRTPNIEQRTANWGFGDGQSNIEGKTELGSRRSLISDFELVVLGNFFALDFWVEWAQGTYMKLILTTHNVTLTEAIEAHILTRIDKLEHLDRFAINARVTLDHDSTKAPARAFKCSMRLCVPGPDLFAEDSEADLYAAIDLVTKKIEQQIRKRHSKHKAQKHTIASRTKRRRQEAEM
jgi:putative sigma-54 modulation protein